MGVLVKGSLCCLVQKRVLVCSIISWWDLCILRGICCHFVVALLLKMEVGCQPSLSELGIMVGLSAKISIGLGTGYYGVGPLWSSSKVSWESYCD